MGEFDTNKYKRDYNKQHYTTCMVRLKPKEEEILNRFCRDLDLSKSALLQKCMIYCYRNMIDVSNEKISKPENVNK